MGGFLPGSRRPDPEYLYDALYVDERFPSDHRPLRRDEHPTISDGFGAFRWTIQASSSPRR